MWDTTAPNSFWLLGVAGSLNGPMLNDPANMSVTVMVPDGGTLTLFASDYGNGFGFGSGRNLAVTVTFSDGTTATATADWQWDDDAADFAATATAVTP